jgi:hypothetical protein
MAAEIRVDTIKGRSGINTISLNTNTVYFENSVGIGTTNALNAASSSNTKVLNVGIVTANEVYSSTVNVGTGVTLYGSTGIVSATTFYGDGSNLTGISAAEQTTTSGITTTEAVGIATFNAALYRSARARVQITQGSDYQISELHLVHDGTTASFVEPATIATGSLLGDFSVGIGTGAYELKVSMVSVSSATVEAYLERLAV